MQHGSFAGITYTENVLLAGHCGNQWNRLVVAAVFCKVASICCRCMLDQSQLTKKNKSPPRPSSYPLLGPKYPLLGTIYPQLRVQGGSWLSGHFGLSAKATRRSPAVTSFTAAIWSQEQPWGPSTP